MTPFRLAIACAERWRWILVAAVVGALYSVYLSASAPVTYSSSTSFAPQSRRAGGSSGVVSGLAAQLGISVGSADPISSPVFYQELLESGRVFEEVAGDSVDTGLPDAVRRRPISEALNVAPRAPRAMRAATAGTMRRTLRVVVSKSGLLTITATASSPLLAASLAGSAVESVNRFLTRLRQQQAAQERLFAERRLADVKGDRDAAERRLQQFLERNRDYRSSPSQGLQQDRLARDVSVAQQLAVSVAQAVEQARVEEVRTTPSIVTVELPSVPSSPNRRFVRSRITTSALMGAVFAVIAVIAGTVALWWWRQPGDDMVAFRAAWGRRPKTSEPTSGGRVS